MKILSHIPNILTLSNAFLGCVAIAHAARGEFTTAAFLLIGAMICDFFDGFAARKLGVSGELGKQLDSLADAISFGLAPAFVLWQLLGGQLDVTLLVFVSAVGAVLRLARFNLSDDQSYFFIGLPSPAWAIFLVAQIAVFSDHYIMNQLDNGQLQLLFILMAFAGAYLMNNKWPFMALKWKAFTWKYLKFKLFFLALSVVFIFTFSVWAIYFIGLAYVLFSFLEKYQLSTVDA